MSKLLNRLAGEPEENTPAPPLAQQLELLGPLPLSIKDPPSVTAPIPPRNSALGRTRAKAQAEPMLTPPAELDKLHSDLAGAEIRARTAEEQIARTQAEAEVRLDRFRSEQNERMESLRMEIASLQDSRDGERRSRLVGEQRIRELEEQLGAVSVTPAEESGETRQALDEAQTQLDDLRSQFRHLEGSHEEQAHKAEQRVKELSITLDREKKAQVEFQQEAAKKHQEVVDQNRELTAALEVTGNELATVRQAMSDRDSVSDQELQAARKDIDRLTDDIDRLTAEAVKNAEGIDEELIQARMRVEDLETRLCTEAEIRGRAERQAGEAQAHLDEVVHQMDQLRQEQARQAGSAESHSRDADQQIRQAMVERDEAVGLAQKAQALREQDAVRFQERERLAAQRLAALRRVESPASARLPTRALSTLPLPWPLLVVLLLVVSLGVFWLGRWQGMTRPASTENRAIASSSDAPEAGEETLVRSPVPKPIAWPSIKGNFLRVQSAPGRMTILFEYAVFSRRTEIHPDALRDLQKLARQLAPLTGGFRFEIIGHTDADPVSARAGEYTSNLELGLKRAQVVRDVLIRQGGLPSESLTAISVGEVNPPYPNTSLELRKKNRTVTIAVIPK